MKLAKIMILVLTTMATQISWAGEERKCSTLEEARALVIEEVKKTNSYNGMNVIEAFVSDTEYSYFSETSYGKQKIAVIPTVIILADSRAGFEGKKVVLSKHSIVYLDYDGEDGKCAAFDSFSVSFMSEEQKVK